MKKKLSVLFHWVAIVAISLAFGLMMLHLFLGDRHFDTGKNFFPPESQFLRPDVTEFNVAIMGDSGNNNLVLEKIIRDTRHDGNKYDFILYLGDLVMNRHETYFYWMLSEIQPKLHHRPFYMTPGNHDVIHDGDTDKSFYRSVMGPTYYWFGYGDTLFIGLDSSADFMEAEQFTWLESTLARIRPNFRHCIIFSHRPPQVLPGRRDHKMDAESIERLRPIIRRYRTKIDAMFFGHVHYYSAQTFEGVPIYTAPTAGQGSYENNRFGYISLKIRRDGIASVTPMYVTPPEYRREYFELFWAGQVLSPNLKKIVFILLMTAVVFHIAYRMTRRD